MLPSQRPRLTNLGGSLPCWFPSLSGPRLPHALAPSGFGLASFHRRTLMRETRNRRMIAPPLGFGSLRRIQPGQSIAGLPHQPLPSQGFSPSQGLAARALWVYFAPLPPIGFCLQSFSHSGSRTPLGAVALLPVESADPLSVSRELHWPSPSHAPFDQPHGSAATFEGDHTHPKWNYATSSQLSSGASSPKNQASGQHNPGVLDTTSTSGPSNLLADRRVHFRRAWTLASEPYSA